MERLLHEYYEAELFIASNLFEPHLTVGRGKLDDRWWEKNLSAIQALGHDQNIFKKYYSELKFTQNVVNKPCIFHWKFQPNFCENNECQRMFEGSVWPIGEWTCNNLIRELLCLSFLSSSHLLSSPATCYLQIRTRWVSQFGSPLKRVMGAVLGKNRADFFLLKLWAQNKVCRTNNGRNFYSTPKEIFASNIFSQNDVKSFVFSSMFTCSANCFRCLGLGGSHWRYGGLLFKC